jgi:hypothetical protein
VPPEYVVTLAAEHVTEVRWLSAEELATATAVTAPRRLADLVTGIRSGPLPAPDTNLGT